MLTHRPEPHDADNSLCITSVLCHAHLCVHVYLWCVCASVYMCVCVHVCMCVCVYYTNTGIVLPSYLPAADQPSSAAAALQSGAIAAAAPGMPQGVQLSVLTGITGTTSETKGGANIIMRLSADIIMRLSACLHRLCVRHSRAPRSPWFAAHFAASGGFCSIEPVFIQRGWMIRIQTSMVCIQTSKPSLSRGVRWFGFKLPVCEIETTFVIISEAH
jgi:hypothetical protein